MREFTRALFSCLLLTSATSALAGMNAASEGGAIVASGSSLLSWQSAQVRDWRLAEAGDRLCDDCDLRTSAFGAATIVCDRATLHLDEMTRVTVAWLERKVTVHAGRVQLELADETQAWTMVAEPGKLQVLPGATVQLVVQSAQPLEIVAVRGALRATSANIQRELVAPLVARLARSQPKLVTESLTPEAAQKLTHWLPSPRPSLGLGQLLIEDAQSNATTRLHVARYHAHVILRPPVALVQIDQSFYNPHEQQEQGTFVFNLPPGASVSRFAMYVTPQQLIEGELIERDRAADIYRSIVNARRDPAILEEIGDNLFRMRVFPIFAHDTKRILLDYTLALTTDGVRSRFELPLLSDRNPIWDFGLSGQILGGVNTGSVSSPTYPNLEIRHTDEAATFHWNALDFVPRSNLILEFTPPPIDKPVVHSQKAEPLPTNSQNTNKEAVHYFQLDLPAVKADVENSAGPADVLLLVDTSGSIANRELTTRCARTLAGNLRSIDRFRIGGVDVGFRPLDFGWNVPGTPGAEQSIAALDKEFSLGRTEFAGSFQEALRQTFKGPTNGRRRVVVYLGDGIGSMGRVTSWEMSSSLIPECQQAQAAFCAIWTAPADRVQTDWNRLVEGTGGTILDGMREHREIFRWALGGCEDACTIEQVGVDGCLDSNLFFPKHCGLGQPLQLFGSTPSPGKHTLKYSILKHGKRSENSFEFELPPAGDDLFVGRLWAQRRIRQFRPNGAETTNLSYDDRAEVIRLSREWSVLSPYTAFLVLESEQDYVRWQIDRQARRRYWKPGGSLQTIPLPDTWLARLQKERNTLVRADDSQELLEQAERLVAKQDYQQAYSALKNVDVNALAADSTRHQQLLEQATAGLAQNRTIELAKSHFPIFDPIPWLRGPARRPLRTASRLPENSTLPGMRFSSQLARDVAITLPKMSLRSFMDWIESTTGVDVRLDRLNAQSDAVDESTLVILGKPALSPNRIAIGSLARHVLGQHGLRLVEIGGELVVTNRMVEESKLGFGVYSIDDILFTDRVASHEQLALSPFAHRIANAETMIQTRLEQPISLTGRNTPLEDILESVAAQLNINVWLRTRELEGTGRGSDTPITISANNVPAHIVLARMLEELECNYCIKDEALVVSSLEDCESAVKTRLYSARGLVARGPRLPDEMLDNWEPEFGWERRIGGIYRDPLSVRKQPPFTNNGFMGGGGMGGGGMGGGGSGPPTVVGVIPVGAALGSGLSEGGDDAQRLGVQVDAKDESRPAKSAHEVGQSQQVAETTKAVERADHSTSAANVRQQKADLRDILRFVQFLQKHVGNPKPGWLDDGGVGAIEFCDPTFDFVISTTDHVHGALEDFCQSMRSTPLAGVPGHEFLSEPTVTAQNAHQINPDALLRMFQSVIAVPNPGWTDDGGVGTIDYDPGRAALIVSTTAAVHEEFHTLLTMLRRSRFRARQGYAPWESDAVELLHRVRGIPVDSQMRQGSLPAPDEVAVRLLNVRQAGDQPTARWEPRLVLDDGTLGPAPLWAGDGGPLAYLAFERRGSRLMFATPDVSTSLDGDHATIATASACLLEETSWAEGIRSLLDDLLPWYPHRTNAELSQRFAVSGAPEQSTPEQTVLRLVPRQSAASASTFFMAGFEVQGGLIARFEMYVANKRVAALRFADRQRSGSIESWGAVTLETDDGRPILRWTRGLGDPIVEPETLATDSWVRWNHEPGATPSMPRLASVQKAIATSDWNAVAIEWKKLPPELAELPLLRAAYANSVYFLSKSANDDTLNEHLLILARQGAVSLLRTILDDPGFVNRLSADRRFGILAALPHDQLRSHEFALLAQAALELNQFEAAAKYANQITANTGDDRRDYLDLIAKLKCLAQAGHPEVAGKVAIEYASQNQLSVQQRQALATTLASTADLQFADTFLDAQLASADLSAPDRLKLSHLRARLTPELPGWLMLVKWIEMAYSDGQSVELELALLATEVNTAHDAAKLAQAAQAPWLRFVLLELQASRTHDPAGSAELWWHVIQSGHLSAANREAAARSLLGAGRREELVQWLESDLRRGQFLTRAVLNDLARTYHDLGRLADEHRALSDFEERRIRTEFGLPSGRERR